MERIDTLARSTEARTILFEEDLSLYSPYESRTTSEFLGELRRQRDEVFALFEVTDEKPIRIWLRPNEALGVDFAAQGDSLRLTGVRRHTEDGVLGRAAGDLMVIEVDPPRLLRLGDGREITSVPGASLFSATIRHEMTHIAAKRAGLRAAGWLTEGIAHAVEWIPIEAGRFQLEPVPKELRPSPDLPHDAETFERLLHWKQAFPSTPNDSLMRGLGMFLTVFALEEQHAPSLAEGLRRVAALGLDQLRALQPAWSTWIESLAAAEDASVSPPEAP